MKQELAIILIVLGVFGLFGGYITGFLVTPDTKQVSINFTSAYFVYNPSEFEITDTIKLKGQVVNIEKNLSNTTEYKISKALFEPDKDNTDKLKDVDEINLEINSNKPLYLALQSEISSGDYISIKINPNKDSIINICDFDLGCSKQYGSLNYNNSNQSNTITISNLESPTKNFLLTSTEEIKIDQIKSSSGDLERAITDPKDRTSKISYQDAETQNIENDKLVYLVFESKPKSGSEIKFYITDGEDSKITACSFPSCSVSYGSVNYDKNQKGVYNITLTSSPENKIILKSEKSVDIDYINASITEKWTETTFNTVYPSTASLETKEIAVPNVAFWGSLKYNKKENNQTLKLFYSTNNSQWIEIQENENLTSVQISERKIKFKINLSTDTKSTPEITNMTLLYTANIPSYFDQSIVQDSSKRGSIVNLTFNATNPDLIKSVYADVLDSTGKNIGRVQLNYSVAEKIFLGQWNTTSFKEAIYLISLSIDSNYTELKSIKDRIALISDVKGSFSSQPQISGNIFHIDGREKAGTEIELKAEQANTTINIVQYSKNIRDVYPKEKEIGKYVEIVTEENITGLESAKIKLYYNDTDISSSGVDENTLSIQYYNETSGTWEKLNSTVNATGNYVEIITSHFSTYGVFGTETNTQTANTQSSSSYSQRQDSIPNQESLLDTTSPSTPSLETTKPVQTEIQNKSEEVVECTPSIEIQIPTELGSGEREIYGKVVNSGDCDIENLQLEVTEDIKEFVSIEPSVLEKIVKGSEKSFTLKSLDEKATLLLSPISGLAIAPEKLSSQTLNGKIIIKSANYSAELSKAIDISVEVPIKSSGAGSLTFLISIVSIVAGLILFFVKRK